MSHLSLFPLFPCLFMNIPHRLTMPFILIWQWFPKQQIEFSLTIYISVLQLKVAMKICSNTNENSWNSIVDSMDFMIAHEKSSIGQYQSKGQYPGSLKCWASSGPMKICDVLLSWTTINSNEGFVEVRPLQD